MLPEFFHFGQSGGSTTSAACPSLCLVYWYMNTKQNGYDRGIPGPYHSELLPAVNSLCEEMWGKGPEIFTPLPSNRNGLDNFKNICIRWAEGDQEIREYEKSCFRILKWLLHNGNICGLYVPDVWLKQLYI